MKNIEYKLQRASESKVTKCSHVVKWNDAFGCITCGCTGSFLLCTGAFDKSSLHFRSIGNITVQFSSFTGNSGLDLNVNLTVPLYLKVSVEVMQALCRGPKRTDLDEATEQIQEMLRGLHCMSLNIPSHLLRGYPTKGESSTTGLGCRYLKIAPLIQSPFYTASLHQRTTVPLILYIYLHLNDMGHCCVHILDRRLHLASGDSQGLSLQ